VQNDDIMKRALPKPPKAIQHILNRNYAKLDSKAPEMLGYMQSQRGITEFAHARTPFHVHLTNTWTMLHAWNQPEHVTRCGMFHSIYSGQVFYFREMDMTSLSDRQKLRDVVGERAEQTIYNFCDTNRQKSMPLADYSGTESSELLKPLIEIGKPLTQNAYDFELKIDPSRTHRLTSGELAEVILVTVADIAEQLVGTNTFLDIYQKPEPTELWPGDGSPGLGYSFFSKMCYTARPFLSHVPPIFENCSKILDPEEEAEARRIYWKVTLEESRDMSKSQIKKKIDDLEKCARLNPYIAEPHVLMAQCFYNLKDYDACFEHCCRALELFYSWGTAWDKRRFWEQWIGFTKLYAIRAARMKEGKTDFPWKSVNPNDPSTMQLCYLHDLVQEFDRVSEPLSD